MLVVPIFMVIYYRFAGIVAVIALVANMILLIGSMAFIQATFSLPGLAGLALTIGMAVDANVLVFERMREEKERGASVAQQIRNGFNRAWITIFDSHVTNLLAAIVLYAVGTEAVRGFALTMIIGMLWNLYHSRVHVAGHLRVLPTPGAGSRTCACSRCGTRPTSTSSARAITAWPAH